MLDSVTAKNLQTNATITLNDLTYPLITFAWDYEIKGEGEPKMQKPGRHPALKQVDFMTIEMEGNIMADPSQNYWVIRKALMEILLPPIDADPDISLNHVRFDIVISGPSQQLYAEATLADFDAPVEALSPTRTEMRFSWEIPFGYWRDAGSGAAVYI